MRRAYTSSARHHIRKRESHLYPKGYTVSDECCRKRSYDRTRDQLSTRLEGGEERGEVMSPLYCVVKLRYALRASSIESSESQGLETISWSSAESLMEDCRKGVIAGAGLQDRCRSAGLAGSESNKLTIPELLGLRDLGLHFPPSSIWDFGGGESGHSSRLVVSGKERGWRCGMCLVVEAGGGR